MAAKSSDQSFAKLPTAGKVGLLGLLLGFLGAVYYFAAHMPLAAEIQSAEARHRSLQTQLTEAQARNSEYLRLRQELASREAIDRGNLRALPESAETASFLGDLNQQAELSGLRIRLVEPRPEEPDTHYVRLPVNLQLAGSYHHLARFFYNVSRLERLISMENIHLHAPVMDADQVVLSVDVLATTYRRPSAEEAQPQNASAPARAGGRR